MCIDINNYIFVVSNGVGNMVIVIVELIVNCEFCISKINCYFLIEYYKIL